MANQHMETKSVVFYCNGCNQVIWACEYEFYKKDKESKKEFYKLFNSGLKTGLMDKSVVKECFGCICNQPNKE